MKIKLTLAVLAVAALPAVLSPGSASATYHVPTTKVLVTTRCSRGCAESVGVYKARPRHIYLSDGFGGLLTLHWTHWRMRSATGYGSSYAVLAGGRITARVKVSLGVWENALFTFMQIRFTHVRNHDVITGSVSPMRGHVESLAEDFTGVQPAWLPLHHAG